MKKNIVLVGFMGAGKTLVSKRLSEILKRPRVSIDELIVAAEQRSIAAIFAESGETYFRQREKEITAQIALQENLVIDCGGGVVLQEENIQQLKKNGILFYLSASPDVIYGRTKDKRDRPLLSIPNPQAKIQELLNQRRPFYAQADFTIDTDGQTVEDTAQEVLAKLKAII